MRMNKQDSFVCECVCVIEIKRKRIGGAEWMNEYTKRQVKSNWILTWCIHLYVLRLHKPRSRIGKSVAKLSLSRSIYIFVYCIDICCDMLIRLFELKNIWYDFVVSAWLMAVVVVVVYTVCECRALGALHALSFHVPYSRSLLPFSLSLSSSLFVFACLCTSVWISLWHTHTVSPLY